MLWNFPHQGGGTRLKKNQFLHTSLREESAESVVGVGLLALLSEESIGLLSMLVADVYLSARK
jgi:hypothetical protein